MKGSVYSMLKVLLGKDYLFMDNKVSYVSDHFDDVYENSWFESDFAKRVVQDIDEVTYFGSGDVFLSEYYGAISARDLSSGTKALLLLANCPGIIVSGDRMGDNCVPFLMELAATMDITITLCHLMKFEEPFELYCVPQNRVITSRMDFLLAWEEVRPGQWEAYDTETKKWVNMEAVMRG